MSSHFAVEQKLASYVQKGGFNDSPLALLYKYGPKHKGKSKPKSNLRDLHVPGVS